MLSEINVTKEEHSLTSEDKLKWWGYGEWVEEVDLLEFTYKEIDCIIKRVYDAEEPYAKEFHVFGGHLCGYIRIPENHPYYNLEISYSEIDIRCHYGLTFGDEEDQNRLPVAKTSNGRLIGFDCAHSCDITPSMQKLYKTDLAFIEIEKSHKEMLEKFDMTDSPLFNKTYKNIQFCIDECKSMVDQLLEVKV